MATHGLGRRFGCSLRFEPGKAILEVAQNNIAGHDATCREVGVAFSKCREPVNWSGDESVFHCKMIGGEVWEFQPLLSAYTESTRPLPRDIRPVHPKREKKAAAGR